VPALVGNAIHSVITAIAINQLAVFNFVVSVFIAPHLKGHFIDSLKHCRWAVLKLSKLYRLIDFVKQITINL
jgi:hypothetical protein